MRGSWPQQEEPGRRRWLQQRLPDSPEYHDGDHGGDHGGDRGGDHGGDHDGDEGGNGGGGDFADNSEWWR